MDDRELKRVKALLELLARALDGEPGVTHFSYTRSRRVVAVAVVDGEGQTLLSDRLATQDDDDIPF